MSPLTSTNDPNLAVCVPTHGYNDYNHGYRWAQNPSESNETHSLGSIAKEFGGGGEPGPIGLDTD